ncbi:MAG: DUF2480 family protein, partial [Flavobacteriaceae bacterium]|nr:DUF2480 family protein [Flavobacteriaceae bacterium]
MKDEIVNRVANSKLITIDLENLYPEGKRMTLDISEWLSGGVILREKEFRQHLKDYDWSPYKDAFVSIYCITDAILPEWAFMLVAIRLNEVARKAVVGSPKDLETLLFSEIITNLDISEYKDKPIIIKGCTNKPIPKNAYVLLAQKLQPLAKSILYGEACSSVPL